MITITKAEVSKLRLGELIEFSNTILDLFKRVDPKQKLLVSRIKTLNAALATLDKGFTDNAGDSLQAEMRPQDNLRMAAIRGIKRSIQAESFREETSIKEQAAMLLTVYDKYCTNINRISFQHKTLLVRKMLNELATNPEYAKAVQELGLTRWVNDLTAKNNLFYEDHLDKSRNNVSTDKNQKLKKDLISVYRELVKDMNSVARVDDEDPIILSLANELNGIIDAYNEPVNNRTGRKKKEVVEESPPASSLPVIVESSTNF